MEELLIYFTCISIATERLVELTKGMTPLLNSKHANPKNEERRRVALMALASFYGLMIVFSLRSFSNEILPQGWDSPMALVVIALLASGGSGGWNRLLKVKERLNHDSAKSLGTA